MLNPSYLIKSRHNIYYFRYPLPLEVSSENNRVSISLKTRCPREALRLAKILEYHSLNLTGSMDFNHMQYKDVVAVFKDHFAKLLYLRKLNMDEFGPLPRSEVKQLEDVIEMLNYTAEHGRDILNTDTLKSDMHKSIMNMSELYDLNIEPHSDNYKLMQSQYKYVVKNLSKDILVYNKKLINYSLEPDASHSPSAQLQNTRKSICLRNVIDSYLSELKDTISDRSYNEQRDCLNYLIDALGEDYLISNLSTVDVQEVKVQLQNTPTGRNKAKLSRGLTLKEQIEVAKEHELNILSTTSVNKYLGYFSSLFDWAKRNKLIEENLFDGIRIKNNKKDNRRDMFKKDEVALILNELKANKSGLIKNQSQYWGSLIAIYTGARRNEIGALMVDDVKQDQESGIWYFNITDEEEEGKDLKSGAANRLVPVHSELINLGFMNYLKEAKEIVKTMPNIDGMQTRLLFDFTYTGHDKWGRKLGQFVNERLLKYLGIHVKNKKTLHSLRHSFITYLDVASVEATTIKSMVGHEQGTVTHGIYTHYGVDHLKKFKGALEKLPY